MLTLNTLAETLSVSKRTALRLLQAKKVRGFQVGRVWRIEQAELDAYIAEQKFKASEPKLVEIRR